MVGPSARHAHLGERAEVDVAREVHELVLAGAAGQHAGVLAARALDQYLLDSTDALLVAGPGTALDHDLEAGEPLGGDLGGHEAVGHGRGLGTGPGTEDERVRAVVAGFGHDL